MSDQLPNEEQHIPAPSHQFAKPATEEAGPDADNGPQESSLKRTRESEVADREERQLRLSRMQTEAWAENERARKYAAEADKTQAEAKILSAQARDIDAEATKKEEQAEILAAQAVKDHHAADKEPNHQRQALAAGWVRIGLTIFLTLASVAFLYIGYVVDPVAFVPAALSGGSLASFAPWQFLPSRRSEPKENPPPEEDGKTPP